MVWGLVTDLSKLDLTNVIQIGLSQEFTFYWIFSWNTLPTSDKKISPARSYFCLANYTLVLVGRKDRILSCEMQGRDQL